MQTGGRELRCYLCSLKDCWPQCFDRARVCCCPAQWTPGCLAACSTKKWQKKIINRQRDDWNILFNMEGGEWECLRVETAIRTSSCPGCEDLAQHQLRRRSVLMTAEGQSSFARLGMSVFLTVSDHCFFQPDLMDFERRAFVAHGHRAEHHFSQHHHVRRASGALEAQTLLLGFLNFRGARGRAVQGTAAAPGGAELAAFPKHFHLAFSVL